VRSLGDVVVIGGGIAGASAAYFLSETSAADRVTLVEAEPHLAHHTTGRSAAMLTEGNRAAPIRSLIHASLGFLHDPPAILADHPVLKRRGLMMVAATPALYEELDGRLVTGTLSANPAAEVTLAEAAELAPHIAFRPGHRAMYEPGAHDIDVAALHQIYVRGLRSNDGRILTSWRVDAARAEGDRWEIETTAGSLTADVIVNAAGAWGDRVAVTAGIAPVGLSAMRRTAFMVSSPFEGSARYPFVTAVDYGWYLRPDGPQFLCSPGDETPSEPCDARPEEVDVAIGIERLNANTYMNIRSINSSWAGLRTFSPDRSMVIGPEPGRENFLWCVGQGGAGIQSSPGVGQLVADLLTAGAPGPAFAGDELDMATLLPNRFRN
jgi:D-arginine dehydrogenase